MKKLLLFVIIFVGQAIPQTKAQTSVYHPFPDSNAVWNTHYFSSNDCYPKPACIHIESFSYIINGDTLINGLNYHKVYIPYISHTYQNQYCLCFSFWRNEGYNGCIRQDTINKKVWFITPMASSEVLLYDFNAKIGDTISLATKYNRWCAKDAIVIGMDSILIGSDYRKRWKIGTTEYIIEGIGSTYGLFQIACSADLYTASINLLCFKKDEVILYTQSVSTCNIYSSVENTDGENPLSVYPNPATSKIHIERTNSSAIEITLFNILGKQVTTTIKTKEQKTEMDVSGLSEGVYFLRLNDNTNSITRKIIIEK